MFEVIIQVGTGWRGPLQAICSASEMGPQLLSDMVVSSVCLDTMEPAG